MELQQNGHTAPGTSSFLRFPPELRLFIYSQLFDDGGNHCLAIRKRPKLQENAAPAADSPHNYVVEPSAFRRLPRITYEMSTKKARFHTAIMSTNRKIYDETSYLLYAKHSFDFGTDIGAVVPFFQDRTQHSRALISSISLHKISPAFEQMRDKHEWVNMCRFLAVHGHIRFLRLVIEGVRLDALGLGPREFSAADFELLFRMNHPSLDWAGELKRIRAVEAVEVVPYYLDRKAVLATTAVILFNTYSASIENGLADFVKTQLGIPQ